MNKNVEKVIKQEIKFLKLRIDLMNKYCFKLDRKVAKLEKKIDSMKFYITHTLDGVRSLQEELEELESMEV